MLDKEIKEDLERAQKALISAEKNFKDNDFLTAANRSFVACENSVYALLKFKFGSSSISRTRILTRLREIDSAIKETYDKSYDLRVQADYGKKAKLLPLNKENLEESLNKVRGTVNKVKGRVRTASTQMSGNIYKQNYIND